MNTDADESPEIAPTATVGVEYGPGSSPPSIGDGSVVRAGTIIYDDVSAGPGFQTGHHALVREHTSLGEDVLVGTQTVIDGNTVVGNGVSMQTGVYVPSETDIGDRVFLGPNATLLNDMYPVRSDYQLTGPTLKDDASIGANATVLPNVTVGEGAFVAAGTVVTEDVPPETLAIGTPAVHRELPTELHGGNNL
ncbi:acyltransferase [Halobellus sp. EA9]|uniref:acyltransferase n=1 Tax=Halobellus sp. EA9 TaxID=3421647 RepID=UPI003EB7585B